MQKEKEKRFVKELKVKDTYLIEKFKNNCVP
jgi:hypothetical protein